MQKDNLPRNIPKSIVDAVDAVARAGQKYGNAVARQASRLACETLMSQQKKAIEDAVTLIDAELTRRYDGGIEMGRHQQAAQHPGERGGK